MRQIQASLIFVAALAAACAPPPTMYDPSLSDGGPPVNDGGPDWSQCPPADVVLQDCVHPPVRLEGSVSDMASVLDDLCQTPCTAIDALSINDAEVESLTELTPLSRVTKIVNKLEIINNKLLKDLRGLEAITDASWVVVTENPEIASLTGLENIENTAELDVSYNSKLTKIDAFQKVRKMGALFFASSPALADLSSFGESVEIEALSIQSTGLASLQGLGNLRTASSGMNIILNNQLIDINALSGMQFSGRESIIIAGNTLLPQCEALALVAQTTFNHAPKIEKKTI